MSDKESETTLFNYRSRIDYDYEHVVCEFVSRPYDMTYAWYTWSRTRGMSFSVKFPVIASHQERRRLIGKVLLFLSLSLIDSMKNIIAVRVERVA